MQIDSENPHDPRNHSRHKSPVGNDVNIPSNYYRQSKKDDLTSLPSWVRPLTGIQSNTLSISQLSADQKIRLERAKAYAREQNKNLLNSGPVVEIGQLANQKSLMGISRLYVGNIPLECTQEQVKQLFSQYGPIHSAQLTIDGHTGKHKGFAFIEYDVPEASTIALKMSHGLELNGKPLKVGRPNNFSEQLYTQFPKALEERLYIGNVNELIGEEELEGIFQPFGQVKYVRLAPNVSTRRHRGYGYIEFSNPEEAEIAMQAMDGFELGGKALFLTKSEIGGAIIPGMKVLESIPGRQKSPRRRSPRRRSPRRRSPYRPYDRRDDYRRDYRDDRRDDRRSEKREEPKPQIVREQPFQKQPESKRMKQLDLMSKLAEKDNTLSDMISIAHRDFNMKPTKVLLLENMINVDEIDQDLENDVREECESFGNIVKIHFYAVPTHHVIQGNRVGDQTPVRIFVEYENVESCVKAWEKMNGRWFSKKQIHARYYDEIKFSQNDYSS